MSVLHDTADVVQQLLSAADLSKSCEVRFAYDTELLLENLDTLSVDIVAAGLSCVPDSRNSLRYEVLIDIAVRYRFGVVEQEYTGRIDNAEIKPYLDLLEEIGKYLAHPSRRTLADKVAATWTGNNIRVPWVPDHLHSNRQYTGILQATYVVAEEF